LCPLTRDLPSLFSFFINTHMKDIRIKVTTNDGCCTIWYERSKAKNAVEIINNRVYNQLCGLNIKEVDVSVIGK
jgi:hypothetical protein